MRIFWSIMIPVTLALLIWDCWNINKNLKS